MISDYDNTLSTLYFSVDYPADRFASNDPAKRRFTLYFNTMTGGHFTADVVIKRLIQLRKLGDLHTLGRSWRGPTFKKEWLDQRYAPDTTTSSR